LRAKWIRLVVVLADEFVLDGVEAVSLSECFHEADFPGAVFTADFIFERFDRVVVQYEVYRGRVVEIDEKGELSRARPRVEVRGRGFAEIFEVRLERFMIFFESVIAHAARGDVLLGEGIKSLVILIKG